MLRHLVFLCAPEVVAVTEVEEGTWATVVEEGEARGEAPQEAGVLGHPEVSVEATEEGVGEGNLQTMNTG